LTSLRFCVPPLHLGPLVLEPDLHPARGHAQLVSKLNPCLLARHLISLEYLFQDGQLIRACSLALLLVVLVRESAWEFDAVELEQNHSKQHYFSFVFAIIIIIGEVQLNDTSSIDTKAARQFTSKGACLGLDIVKRMLQLCLVQDVFSIKRWYGFHSPNFHHCILKDKHQRDRTRTRRIS